jgi:hypothetical protein
MSVIAALTALGAGGEARGDDYPLKTHGDVYVTSNGTTSHAGALDICTPSGVCILVGLPYGDTTLPVEPAGRVHIRATFEARAVAVQPVWPDPVDGFNFGAMLETTAASNAREWAIDLPASLRRDLTELQIRLERPSGIVAAVAIPVEVQRAAAGGAASDEPISVLTWVAVFVFAGAVAGLVSWGVIVWRRRLRSRQSASTSV